MFGLLALLLSGPAHAASLDLIEVGGMWGTPGATDATATWWNPAGLAVGARPFSFTAEGAPIIAYAQWDRPNPDYGIIDRDGDGVQDTDPTTGEPVTYDYSGTHRLNYNGVVPFVGVSSNFGVHGLGVGAAFGVPFARGGKSTNPDGIGRFSLRDGGITTPYIMLAASYDIADKISIGVGGDYYINVWDVNVDSEAVTDLVDGIKETLPSTDTSYWQDADTEDPGYATNLDFDHLKDSGFTFNAGIYLHPSKKWAFSVAYANGAKLDNTGPLTMTFVCPPAQDTGGTLGAELYGLCGSPSTGTGTSTPQGAQFVGTGEIEYSLPARVQGGLVLTAVPKLRLELMGAWVGWHVFTDYGIHTSIPADQVTFAPNDTQAAVTADLVSQDRLWARGNRDTFWTGVDGKVDVSKRVLVGGRVLYDHSAIPTEFLSTNDFDANAIGLSALGVYRPKKQVDIGLSYGHQFLLTRTVTDSALGLDIDPEQRKEDRLFYPNANGTYTGAINRFGLSVRGRFGPHADKDLEE